jgi:hypothetical protein
VDGRGQAGALVPVLNRRPDGGDDGAGGSHAQEFPSECFEDVGGHGEDVVDCTPGDCPGDDYCPVIPMF